MNTKQDYLLFLKDFIDLNLFMSKDFTIFPSKAIDYRENPLSYVIEQDDLIAICKAFNNLPYNVQYLLSYCIVDEITLLNFSIQHNLDLDKLSFYLDNAILLLKKIYFEYLNSCS